MEGAGNEENMFFNKFLLLSPHVQFSLNIENTWWKHLN